MQYQPALRPDNVRLGAYGGHSSGGVSDEDDFVNTVPFEPQLAPPGIELQASPACSCKEAKLPWRTDPLPCHHSTVQLPGRVTCCGLPQGYAPTGEAYAEPQRSGRSHTSSRGLPSRDPLLRVRNSPARCQLPAAAGVATLTLRETFRAADAGCLTQDGAQ